MSSTDAFTELEREKMLKVDKENTLHWFLVTVVIGQKLV